MLECAAPRPSAQPQLVGVSVARPCPERGPDGLGARVAAGVQAPAESVEGTGVPIEKRRGGSVGVKAARVGRSLNMLCRKAQHLCHKICGDLSDGENGCECGRADGRTSLNLSQTMGAAER